MYNEDRRVLGKLIQQKREEKGLSQQQVADAVGVSQQSVALWEGGSRPRPSVYNKLADLLGLEPVVRTGPSFASIGVGKQHRAFARQRTDTIIPEQYSKTMILEGVRYRIDYVDDRVACCLVPTASTGSRLDMASWRRTAIMRAWSLLQWINHDEGDHRPLLAFIRQHTEAPDGEMLFDQFFHTWSAEAARLNLWSICVDTPETLLETIQNWRPQRRKSVVVIGDD